jgi:hypothetical protein
MRPRISKGLLALVLLTGCVLLFVVVSDDDVQGTQQTTTLASAKVFVARTSVILTPGSGTTTVTPRWEEASEFYPTPPGTPADTWPVPNKSGFLTNVLIALKRCLGPGECIQVEILVDDPAPNILGPFVLAQGKNSLAVDLTSGAGFSFDAVSQVSVQVTWSGLAATTMVTSTLHGFDL